MEKDSKGKVLKKAVVWKDLYFYRKSDAIYQLTVEFCKRFLPLYGDRTVDRWCRQRDLANKISWRVVKTGRPVPKWRLNY